jgi:hypothetical protein
MEVGQGQMTQRYELIHKQLLRNRWRYDSLRDTMERNAGTSYADLTGLRKWFEARHEILTEAYRKAVNDANNIIGKQYMFDQRPRLHDS